MLCGNTIGPVGAKKGPSEGIISDSRAAVVVAGTDLLVRCTGIMWRVRGKPPLRSLQVGSQWFSQRGGCNIAPRQQGGEWMVHGCVTAVCK